jgi:Protein of unknown function (DUF962)
MGAVVVSSDIFTVYLALDYRIVEGTKNSLGAALVGIFCRCYLGCAEWNDGSMVLGMLAGRSWESWIAEYSESHQHPLNRLTHTFGIPIILISLPLLVAGIMWHRVLWVGVALFVGGWVLQFLGHAIEGKPPEFLKDWRFLLVGSRWWVAKIRGKA